jgi:hypothetical protein
MLPDLVQVTARVVREFEALDVDYSIGGSLASSQYGIPRSTRDVDLVADLRPEHVAPLVAALQDEFYLDADMIREAIRLNSSFNAIHLDTLYKVDIFLPPAPPWSPTELARRCAETIDTGDDSVRLYFSSPEDIILHKLDWYRQGGGVSDHQWSDVLGVLKARSGTLDAGYLRHWAGALGLTDLLDRAIHEAGVML